jgi:hypothetical protein
LAADTYTPSVLASAYSAAETSPDIPESRNFSLLGPNRWTAAVLNVKQEALTFATGGFDAANLRAQTRIIAVPGARCTLLGIARQLQLTFNFAAANDAEKLSVEALARALYVYNAAWLGALRTTPLLVPALAGFRVGCLFTLPLEPKLGGGNDRLVTNLATLKMLAESFDDTLEAGLDAVATDLDPLPDCDQLVTAAADRLTNQWTDRGKIVNGLVGNLLLNPYDEILLAVETLLQRKDTDAIGIAVDVVKRLLAEHLYLLAQTISGYAALRQFFFLIDPSPASADKTATLDKLGTALVMAKDGAGNWVDPRLVGPSPIDAPIEPPLPDKQQVNVSKLVAGKTVLVGQAHGRSVPVGAAIEYSRGADKTSWIGPSEAGDVDPIKWWPGNAAVLVKDLGPPAPAVGAGVPVAAAQTRARIELASKIAMNEGLFDSCRAADIGIISTGLQQWSAHVGTELPVLLERFRVQAPEHYDLFFGVYGLQTRAWAPPMKVGIEVTDKKGKKSGVTKLVELDPDDAGTFELLGGEKVIDSTYTPRSYATNPGDYKDNPYKFRLQAASFEAAVEAANPFGADPTVDPLEYFPSYATLFSVTPGKRLQRLPPVGFDAGAFDDLMPRLAFFGGVVPGDKTRRFAPHWCARIRLAGKASSSYRVAQLHTAAWRFTRIDLNEAFVQQTFTVEGQDYTFPELITSSFAAACVLDLHVNAPGNVKAAVVDAVSRTPGPAHVGGVLSEAWRRRFSINVMSARRFPDASAKRDRDGRIIAFHDAPAPAGAAPNRSLSTDPGSFTGW